MLTCYLHVHGIQQGLRKGWAQIPGTTNGTGIVVVVWQPVEAYVSPILKVSILTVLESIQRSNKCKVLRFLLRSRDVATTTWFCDIESLKHGSLASVVWMDVAFLSLS